MRVTYKMVISPEQKERCQRVKVISDYFSPSLNNLSEKYSVSQNFSMVLPLHVRRDSSKQQSIFVITGK